MNRAGEDRSFDVSLDGFWKKNYFGSKTRQGVSKQFRPEIVKIFFSFDFNYFYIF